MRFARDTRTPRDSSATIRRRNFGGLSLRDSGIFERIARVKRARRTIRQLLSRANSCLRAAIASFTRVYDVVRQIVADNSSAMALERPANPEARRRSACLRANVLTQREIA